MRKYFMFRYRRRSRRVRHSSILEPPECGMTCAEVYSLSDIECLVGMAKPNLRDVSIMPVSDFVRPAWARNGEWERIYIVSAVNGSGRTKFVGLCNFYEGNGRAS